VRVIHEFFPQATVQLVLQSGGIAMRKYIFVITIAVDGLLAMGPLGYTAWADCSPGFLANLACQTGLINKQTANGLDQVNAGLGNPISLGHLCVTAAGAFAGPANPIGMACQAMTPNGVLAGTVQ
jgi:hypothetical protein